MQVVEAAALYQSFCSPTSGRQDDGAANTASPGLVSGSSSVEVLAALAWAQHCTPGSQADISTPGVCTLPAYLARRTRLAVHAWLCLALPVLWCRADRPGRLVQSAPQGCQSVTVSRPL